MKLEKEEKNREEKEQVRKVSWSLDFVNCWTV